MEKHFTATGFIIKNGQTLLLWHNKLQMWVPPGGHLEKNEDPATAVLREIHEETGLTAKIIPSLKPLSISYPTELQSPYTILLEDSMGGKERHQHIDFIYFCYITGNPKLAKQNDHPMLWVTENEIASGTLAQKTNGKLTGDLTNDVRILAMAAFKAEKEMTAVSL